MADGTYYSFYNQLLQGQINLLGGNVNVALLSAAYTPDLTNHMTWADVSAYEITGTGYVSKGKNIGSPALTQDNINFLVSWSGTQVQWVSATFSYRYGVVYVNTGVPLTSYLLKLLDPGSVQSVSASIETIAWDTAGILTFK